MSNELSKIACNAAYRGDWIICVFVVLTGPSDSLKKYLNWKFRVTTQFYQWMFKSCSWNLKNIIHHFNYLIWIVFNRKLYISIKVQYYKTYSRRMRRWGQTDKNSVNNNLSPQHSFNSTTFQGLENSFSNCMAWHEQSWISWLWEPCNSLS